jgi:DedD protein
VTETAPTQAPAAATKPSGSWFLQTGAYSTQAVADGQVAQLKKLNVPAFVVQPEAGGKLFRVRIGPFSGRAEAEQVKSRIARRGFQSSITR